ncbi:hypothetical protein [Pseudomonas monteilii]|uniref:hypothetical protein n=1 Tax=Pseudomonas monteilii TaxID=76759 RepID=UPI0015FB5168|nr:hypothetical protein [Pseudomonas monteilii]MBA6105298.1 hypothetical protein [Pseudomonas monteilii]
MIREYDVLYVNMAAPRLLPVEARIEMQVSGLTEQQIEEQLLIRARIELSRSLKTQKKDIAIHGFTLISERSNIKVT